MRVVARSTQQLDDEFRLEKSINQGDVIGAAEHQERHLHPSPPAAEKSLRVSAAGGKMGGGGERGEGVFHVRSY